MPIRVHTARFDGTGTETPQGFLMVPAFFTRTGVFRYVRKDGTIVRELRHPDDVFHADSIATLRMAPLTDDHPEDMVNADNFKELAVGHISENIKADADKLSGLAVVADAKAIRKVKTGKKELSCGYHADTLEESGVYNGERYDCRQTNIRYNHVAIVERGRAGPQVRLRLDSEDAICDEENQPREDEMEKEIIINGVTHKVSQAVYDSIMADRKAEKAKLDAAEIARAEAETKAAEADKAKKDAEDKLATAKTDAEKLTARVDSLEAKLKDRKDATPEEMAAAVAQRTRIEGVAKTVLGKEAKLDGMSNMDVMRQVVEKACTGVVVKDKSDAYIEARFDSVAEDYKDQADRRQQFGHRKPDERRDEDFDSTKAREASTRADSEAWKKPLTASTQAKA